MDVILNKPQFKNKEITKEAMALFYEQCAQYQSALDIWKDIKTSEARKRIIQILKKSSSKDWIKTYGTAVFEAEPETGLKLFIVESQESANLGDGGFGGDFVESYD